MNEILKLSNITKTFPGVVALNNVDFLLHEGEICALLGKNGAGKSTLVKILSGVYQPDCGNILVRGKKVRFPNPKVAFKNGISTVYQEMSLIPDLTVGENILLGRWKTKKFIGIPVVDKKRINTIAHESIRKLKVDLPLNALVSELTIAQKQLCEIAKAISFDPAVLILDEPTSALAAEEVSMLHQVVRNLSDQGHSVIYVTHRLQEIPVIADIVSVLRDGENAGTLPISDAPSSKIARMMVGADFSHDQISKPKKLDKETLLSVRNMSSKGVFNDISFDVLKGEILGIAGLLGSGRTELMRALIGLDPYDCGILQFEDKLIDRTTIQRMKSYKIDMLPEDRKDFGFVPLFSVRENLSLSCLKRISSFGIINKKKEKRLANQSIDALSIKTASQDTPVYTLSGGNQQKVVLGKCLNILPKLLILDEPTRGIDIQAKEQIYDLLRKLCNEQKISMIFISSELEEVLLISDRILIMREGELKGEVDPASVDIEKLTEMVIGEEKHEQQ